MLSRWKAALGVGFVAACSGAYFLSQPTPAAPPAGVVRATEIPIAPEVGGQVAAIKVRKGDHVQAGDVIAELSAVELTAAVAQARAELNAATANRNNVYVGVRAEKVAALAAEIAKAKSRLAYVEGQLVRASALARNSFASQQAFDQARYEVAVARADVTEAEANHAGVVAGPTNEQRAIADAEVLATTAALLVIEQRQAKTKLRAPANGIVSVVVAEIGENIIPGQPVLVIQETGKPWLSFNVREDRLRGLSVGRIVQVAVSGASTKTMSAIVTELRPLGSFATWQAERAVGDHDLNTLRLRIEPQGDPTGLEPGMAVWLSS
ncbi:HlyD family secretion protein [Mesorhizobium escarrei]|uniref:Biotin_lipoyl_2 domain-containing protein n=1 Tax=Mesorhizobium escarrei TaxID=666018 RepID=A0ABN8K665_9HYPH|nr:biotin/lipoyl-binding protein [Mesorhizobium escarrei]CAH2405778.1 Biotin_lipoyl_2 domain-containing protein [Mesorhizobium escarrei]